MLISTCDYLGSSDDEDEDEESDYQGSIGQLVDCTIIKCHTGKFFCTQASPSTFGGLDLPLDNLVKDAAPRDRRCRQAANRDCVNIIPMKGN